MLIIMRTTGHRAVEEKPDLYDLMLGHLGFDEGNHDEGNLLRLSQTDTREMYAANCADLLHGTYPQADAIYEDAIIDLVGEAGLAALREMRMVESCGSIYGRKLYALR